MAKEYEVELFTGKSEQAILFATDKRKLARAAKELAVENGMTCNVTRTAKKTVKFAGIAGN